MKARYKVLIAIISGLVIYLLMGLDVYCKGYKPEIKIEPETVINDYVNIAPEIYYQLNAMESKLDLIIANQEKINRVLHIEQRYNRINKAIEK